MLVTVLYWLYIVIISYLWGHALITFLTAIVKEKTNIHFSVYVVGGFALLTTLATYLSLFIKLSLLANIIVVVPAILYAALQARAIGNAWQKYILAIRQAPFISYGVLFIMLAIALVLSAVPEARFDDGLYYRQAIKWMESYPAILGLGNLHLKLSFNSSWHVLSALFSFSFLGLSMNELNGLIFIVAILFALDGFGAILRKQFSFSDVFKVVTIAPLHLLYPYIVSPTPDLVIPYLVWIIFILFIQKVEQQRLERFDVRSLLILVLSVFAVLIKLSAVPIAVLPVFLLFLQLRNKHYRAVLPVLSIVLFLVTPWFARNVMLSGYLVYPFYQLDLFNVDWKIPAELVQLEVLETTSFAKVRRMMFSEVASLSTVEWMPYWFMQLHLGEKIVVFLNLFISLLLPVYIWQKYIREPFSAKRLGYLVLGITIYGGILFWFITAPHFRYGMAFTLSVYMLAFSYLLYSTYHKWSAYRLPILSLILIIFLVKPLISVSHRQHLLTSQSLLYPVQVPNEALKEVAYKGVTIYVPASTAQCWDAPLPCAPFVVDGLQLRTGKLKDGFMVRNPKPETYSEKRLETLKNNGEEYNIIKHSQVQ